MTQKNNEEIYKALKEEERTLSEKSVGWLNKAFKLKENHGKIEGKGISFTYDGLVHYLAHAGNYEKNMATGKMTTYYDNDCQAVGNFFLYKFRDYIDEMSEKWSEDELVRQIDLLLPQKECSN